MTHGRGSPKSVFLLGSGVDIPRERPFLPPETLSEREMQFPSGLTGR